MSLVPEMRILIHRDAPPRKDGKFVLYWMRMNRRLSYNFALQRAVWWAKKLARPLLIADVLPLECPWACDRFHLFIMEGMSDIALKLEPSAVQYYPFIERKHGEGHALLNLLLRNACVSVTDEYPTRYFHDQLTQWREDGKSRIESVDSCGLLPLCAAERVFSTAYSFRRFLQQNVPSHLDYSPVRNPLKGANLPRLRGLPGELRAKWPPFLPTKDSLRQRLISSLAINHSIGKPLFSGGEAAATKILRTFLRKKLAKYSSQRNDPEVDVTSGLSSYLHFGFISTHQIFAELAERENWIPERLGENTAGHKSGWWGMSESAEGFLDQIVTWREIGFNFCHLRDDYDQFDSLPAWARTTLRKHAADPRPNRYDTAELECACTHDPLWNAAQMQLAREGRIHNYLRMLWGKKIIEWSPSPEQAWETMIELNDKYALDGSDPNSYSGIGWVLGRFDRPWGPERPIFGTIRYMSSENTARKISVKDYIRRYAPNS